MVTAEKNLALWGSEYDWSEAGAEWSDFWGGVESHWRCTVLPRVASFVPAQRVLEIAPGFGRWTAYLLPLAQEYVGVDIAPPCIESCQRRFREHANAQFFVNDGSSLPHVEDRSIDFAFSFDSLVHVEAPVIAAYLQELARVLSPEGVAVIHHSHLRSELRTQSVRLRVERNLHRLPVTSRALLRVGRRRGLDHLRAKSVDAHVFEAACTAAGLACIGQEIVNWGSDRLTDCISVVVRPTSRRARPNVVVTNPHFMQEALSAQAVAKVYVHSAP